MQIARDSGGLWYSAICDFYQYLPHFCSLPVMGFNGLTQFTNMDILDKECIQVYKSKETIQTWMNQKLLALCRQFKQHSLFPNL